MRYRQIPLRLLLLSGAVAALALLVADARSDDPKKSEPRVVVGKLLTPTGSAMFRERGATKFTVLKQGDPIYSGDMIVALPGATIESKNGLVQLCMHADLDKLSPYPILESAAILHSNPKVDLDFTLDRGRIDVLDMRNDGPVKITVRFCDEVWQWTTGEKKTRIALELYGRWPRGTFFDKDDPKQEPTTAVAMVVLAGEVSFMHDDEKLRMHAPPGPALFQWDNVLREAPTPMKLDKIPEWADPNHTLSPAGKRRRAIVEYIRNRIARVGVEGAIGEALESADSHFRRSGLISAAATDNLPRLIAALGNAEHEDVRESAILVLRHWIGRGHGQDMKLYKALIAEKYTPVQAELILHGLHTPGANELARPETFEALIAYLGHDKLAIRSLANWHLQRICGDCWKKVKYDPAGSKEEIDAAVKQWKEMIPEGKLPPRAKEEKE